MTNPNATLVVSALCLLGIVLLLFGVGIDAS